MAKHVSLDQYNVNITKNIARHIQSKFPDCEIIPQNIVLEKPPRPDLGEFACACFPFSRMVKKSPVEIAEILAEGFKPDKYIEKIKAVGPYLNIYVNLATYNQSVCASILSKKDRFGQSKTGKGKKIMIEYSSPNTNKPLHIGHVRNNLIGMALANVLEFSGYKVIKSNLINDRGIHICKSMLAYKKWGRNKTPKSSKIKGDHLVGQYYVAFENALKEEKERYAAEQQIDLTHFDKKYVKKIKEEIKATKDKKQKKELQKKIKQLAEEQNKFEQDFLDQSSLYQEALDMLKKWEENHPETRALWKKMNKWVLEGFHTSYDMLGCKFDKFYYESETYTLGRRHVEQGLERKIFYQKEDGSIWVSAEKMQEIDKVAFKGMPLKDKLLLRSDGTSVYMTQDLGTAMLKFEDYDLDQSLYVVAEEQTLHFKILFTILRMLDMPWADRCKHVGYGMVTLPQGMGKIKSREGTAVDADDLVNDMVERVKNEIKERGVYVSEDKVEKTSLDIALAALKVFVLHVNLEKNIQFDPQKTLSFTGDTGPAIQYSHARVCRMLDKAKEQNIDFENDENIDYSLLKSNEERVLIRNLYEFPVIIAAVVETYNISLLTNYLLALTKLYAKNYQENVVLKAKSTKLVQARLLLAKATAQVVKNGMRLLGAATPESM